MQVNVSCTYVQFKAIVSALGAVRQVIYAIDGAGTGVSQASVLFVSRDFAVNFSPNPPNPLITTFAADFPGALQSDNGIQTVY